MDTCGRNTVRNMREMSKDEVKRKDLACWIITNEGENLTRSRQGEPRKLTSLRRSVRMWQQKNEKESHHSNY